MYWWRILRSDRYHRHCQYDSQSLYAYQYISSIDTADVSTWRIVFNRIEYEHTQECIRIMLDSLSCFCVGLYSTLLDSRYDWIQYAYWDCVSLWIFHFAILYGINTDRCYTVSMDVWRGILRRRKAPTQEDGYVCKFYSSFIGLPVLAWQIKFFLLL